ncbi:MAG: M4 family metallopeptidase [Colwellia sp.]|nr:M4 family metallopeptidase [Colwellia sp.]
MRLQQHYDGVPIWGRQIVVHLDKSNTISKINGELVTHLKADINRSVLDKDSKSSAEVFEQIKARHAKTVKFSGAELTYEQNISTKIIYLNENNNAILAYHISYLVQDKSGFIEKPSFIVNATNLKVIKQWNDLKFANATGPGGNEKTGRYEYGSDFSSLNVTELDGICTMENLNVKTINLDHGTNGDDAYSFTCPENTHKEVNGAYSPLNDAHYFGNAIFSMFSDWYDVAPLAFQLVMRVHYSSNYENAFWDGRAMTFGDGASRFYPLTSLDISAHEVAHGVTEQNSGLIYANMSGGINEAFSDMSGEAAEFYVRGSNDWLSGAEIFKADGALRYYEDPTLDGVSIGHADDYTDSLDVHWSSGVFNRAFYLLANTNGWTTKTAYDVMLDANRNYWTPSTTFTEGACGAIHAADDLDYTVYDVINAFEEVGITCDNLPFIDADNDGMSDYWEQAFGLDATDASDAILDLDNDGLNNLAEYIAGTLPNNIDSDSDTLTDGDEVNIHLTNPAKSDTDDDDLADNDEINVHLTNPLIADTETDGMPDGWEVLYGLDPLIDDSQLDLDNDSVSNLDEFIAGTNPTLREYFESEPNDAFASAQNINNNFTLSYSPDIGNNTENTSESIPHVTITATGDNSYDYFTFTVASAPSVGIFDIDYAMDQGGSFDSYLRLYNQQGELIDSNDDAGIQLGQQGSLHSYDSFLIHAFNSPGEYTIKVSQYSDSPISVNATYQLNISLESIYADTDSDGMPDSWEDEFSLDKNNPDDAAADNDSDNLTNLEEFTAGTNPTIADTDSDGLNDGAEINEHNTSPIQSDSDADGLSDGEEINTYLSDPNNSDTDNDGLSDGDEVNLHATNLLLSDSDNDGLGDGFEIQFGFNANENDGEAMLDHDNDNLSTLLEFTHGTDPYDIDTDNDTLSDGDEVLIHGTNPLNIDSDEDLMPDNWELTYGLLPLVNDANSDLDADTWSNLAEFQHNTDPSDANSIPNILIGYSINTNNELFKIELLTGQTHLIGALLGGDFEAITFGGNDTLYAVESSTNSLYRINVLTAETTLIGALNIEVDNPGLTFDSQEILHLVNGNENGSLYTIDTDSGLANLVGSYQGDFINAITWDGRDLWALSSAGTSRLYKIDKNIGSSLYIGQLNSVNLTKKSGFSIDENGNLWGIDEDGKLFSVDKISGNANVLQNLEVGFTSLAINNNIDNDADGMPNDWELTYGLDINDPSDALLDNDADNLNNISEFHAQSDPLNPDTDGDLLPDGDEVQIHGTSASSPDTDNDELTDYQEIMTYQTNPLLIDSENDGMPDGWEVNYGLNPLIDDSLLDLDADGTSNIDEFINGSNPAEATLAEQEPNNSLESAQNIDGNFNLHYSPDIGDEMSNTSENIAHVTIIGTGDNSYDFFSFTVVAVPSVGIFDIDYAADHGGSFDSYLRLYNDNDTFLDSNDDNNPSLGQSGSTSGLDSFLRYNFTELGTYSIKVSRYSDQEILDGATYQLNISLESPIFDSDGDLIPDHWEDLHGLNKNDSSDASNDNDNDNLTNLEEFTHGTLPNNADTDSDGLPDGWEVNHNFDANNAENSLIDEDNDGLTLLEEYLLGTDYLLADSDNDSVIDSEDNAPLDSTQGSNQAPEFSTLSEITFEATANLSRLNLPLPQVTDNNTVTPLVSLQTENLFALGSHEITWHAIDFSGNESTAIQIIHVVDTTAPDISTLSEIVTIGSKGLLTLVKDLGDITAHDLVDGIITVTTEEVSLQVGRHTLPIFAEDLSGNSIASNINILVEPMVQIMPEATVMQGQVYKLTLSLNAPALTYPVTVDYLVTHENSADATYRVQITAGISTQLLIEIPSGEQAGNISTVELLMATNANVYSNFLSLLTITDENLPPRLEVKTSQQGKQVSFINPRAGDVTIDFEYIDTNNDSYSHIWTSDELINTNTASRSFIFDPLGLTKTEYAVELSATELNTPELYNVKSSISLFIINDFPTLLNIDTDGDGINDIDEGFSDSDGDGIADYLDNDTNTTRLPISESNAPLQTTLGQKLMLGSSVFSTKNITATDATLTKEQLRAKLAEVDDNTADPHFAEVNSIINFTVANISHATGSATVVIPLDENSLIPAQASFRKYSLKTGWFTFIENELNSLKSAMLDSNGNCPVPLSNSYQNGLLEHHQCIELTIEDGGPNDADELKNGSVEDPGVLASTKNQAPTISISLPDSIEEDKEFTIDASETVDLDNDTLTFTWRQVSGPAIDINAPNDMLITLKAPQVTTDQVIVIELEVNDSYISTFSSRQITVKPRPAAPVVAISADKGSSGGVINMSLYLWLTLFGVICYREKIKRGKKYEE